MAIYSSIPNPHESPKTLKILVVRLNLIAMAFKSELLLILILASVLIVSPTGSGFLAPDNIIPNTNAPNESPLNLNELQYSYGSVSHNSESNSSNFNTPQAPPNYQVSTLDIWNDSLLEGNVVYGTNPIPSSMLFDPSNNCTYVTEPQVSGLTVLNSKDQIVDTIRVGTDPSGMGPFGIAYDPSNNEIYVSNFKSNTVSIINSSNRVISNVTVTGPNGIAYDPLNGYIYVASYFWDSVIVLNNSNNIVANISYLPSPNDIAYNPSNGFMYVTTGSGISVINSANTVVKTIKGISGSSITYDPLNQEMFVSWGSNGFIVINSGNTIVTNISSPGFYGVQAAFDSANGDIYLAGNINTMVVNSENNVVANIAGIYANCAMYNPFSQTIFVGSTNTYNTGEIDIIGSNNSIIDTIGLGSYPSDIAYNSYNHQLYISEKASNSVAVIGKSNRIIKNISVGNDPNAVLFDPLNNYIYVANAGSNYISIINSSNYVVGNITSPSVNPGNITPSAIALDTTNGYLYVSSSQNNLGYIFDPATNSVISTYVAAVGNTAWGAWGPYPSSITWDSENGYVYEVLIGYGILVLNSTGQGIKEISLPYVSGVAYDPYDHLVYASESSSSVCMINSQNQIIGNITVGFSSNYISYDAVHQSMLVAGSTGYSNNGYLAIINSTTNAVRSLFAAGYGSSSAVFDNNSGSFYVTNDVSQTISIFSRAYSVIFNESGLPPGTEWYLNISGQKSLSSNATSITAQLSNGSYSFTIATSDKDFTPSPGLGYLTVNGTSISVRVTFNEITNSVTFKESGLPSGTSWSITLKGTTESSSTSTITFSVPNGTYSFTVGSVSGYTSSPSSGSITVSGSGISKTITFTPVQVNVSKYTVTFTESGLPSGTSWSITFNGTTESFTTSTLTFSVPNGTYTYSIGSVSGYTVSPSTGSITVNGVNTNQAITFTPVITTIQKYNVTFTETGLPSGTSWSVTLNGTTGSSKSSAITFSLPNGSYSYTITTVNGYKTTLSSGSINVSGSSIVKSITFTSTSSPKPSSGIPSMELYVIIAAVIIIVAVAAGVLLMRRKK